MSVTAEDGNILYNETVYFSASAKNEWDKVNTTTGTSINAGRYRIRLVASKAEGLMIDNLKVQ